MLDSRALPVSTDTHDHAGRDPRRNDAAQAATPTAVVGEGAVWSMCVQVAKVVAEGVPARRLATMVVNCPAHGPMVGRCKLSWRDERVRRPGRSKKRARNVFVVMGAACSPSPRRTSQRDRLWAMAAKTSQAALAANQPEGIWLNPAPYLRSFMTSSHTAWRRWSASSSTISQARLVTKAWQS